LVFGNIRSMAQKQAPVCRGLEAAFPELSFFAKIAELLADDGVMLLHSIGHSDGPTATNRTRYLSSPRFGSMVWSQHAALMVAPRYFPLIGADFVSSNLDRYERIAPLYDLLDLPFEYSRYPKIRPLLFQGLKGRVLDAGIGTGRNIQFYPNEAQVVGIDISPAMLARAERKRLSLGADVELHQGGH
jgi:Methyltransferase domain